MMRQQAVWRLISDSLQQDIPVMLLYVLQSKGSSPGRKGFAMAVNDNGEMVGSIGGGIMEHKFVEMAKEQLQDTQQLLTIKQQIHDKVAAKNQSGMICSGEQIIFLYRVRPADCCTVKNLLTSLNENSTGLLRLSPAGIEFDEKENRGDVFTMRSETDWLYEEKIGFVNHLYIIGGGHCALALSRMMRMMDFYIHVFENRPELNTLQQNEYAHEVTVLDDYSALEGLVTTGITKYVVVMTTGYRTDDIALKALLTKEFKYLGVLGSKKKIKKLFGEYAALGIDAAWLKKIHSPIGIQIKSQTPEEIAISIAAQIIKVKNAALA